jgi:hypothetical protein
MDVRVSRDEPLQAASGRGSYRPRLASGGDHQEARFRRCLQVTGRVLLEHFAVLGYSYFGQLPPWVSARLQARHRSASGRRAGSIPLSTDELAWQAELDR